LSASAEQVVLGAVVLAIGSGTRATYPESPTVASEGIAEAATLAFAVCWVVPSIPTSTRSASKLPTTASSAGDDENLPRFNDGCAAASSEVGAALSTSANCDIKGHAAGDIHLGEYQCASAAAFFSSSTATSRDLNLDRIHAVRNGPRVRRVGVIRVEIEANLLVGEGRWCGNDECPNGCRSNGETAPCPRAVVRGAEPKSHTSECERSNAEHQPLALPAR